MTDDVATIATEQAPAGQALTDLQAQIRRSVAEQIAESICDDTLVRLKRGEAFEARGMFDERVHRIALLADKLLSDAVLREAVNVPEALSQALEREFPMLDGDDRDALADGIANGYAS